MSSANREGTAEYKVPHFIKRKPHLTHEQFKDHFERSHAAMALKFCGHLFTEYRRNYVGLVYAGGDSRQEGSGYGPREWEWDLISEWILPDEAALNEIYRIMQQPGIDELFRADEDRFIDRTATVTVTCDVRCSQAGLDAAPRASRFAQHAVAQHQVRRPQRKRSSDGRNFNDHHLDAWNRQSGKRSVDPARLARPRQVAQ